MSELSSFIYCLNAERVPGNNVSGENINAIGVLSTIVPEFVPGTFSFSIVFSVLDIDTTANNTVRIIFSMKDSSKFLVDSGIISLPPLKDQNEIELPDEYKGLNMSMDFRNVVFEKEGIYTTKIIFNDKLLGEKPIYVKGKR